MSEESRLLEATFCLYHEDLDPEEVSRALRLQPSLAFRRGDSNVGKSGRRFSDHSTGAWLLYTRDRVREPDLEAHLTYLLDEVEPAADAVRAFAQRGYRISLFCGLTCYAVGGGPTLRPKTLERIARLGAQLEFDLYTH